VRLDPSYFCIVGQLGDGMASQSATISAAASAFEQSGASRYSSPISVTMRSVAAMVEVSEDGSNS